MKFNLKSIFGKKKNAERVSFDINVSEEIFNHIRSMECNNPAIGLTVSDFKVENCKVLACIEEAEGNYRILVSKNK